MSLNVNIYGQLVEVPDQSFEVENWGTDNPTEQYWRREDIPEFFEIVEFDKQKNLLLTSEQEAYAKREVERCKKGFYFMNNGVLTYITGKHYFYLKWWKLENDIYPDYRDSDRRYFLFLNHWENIHWCLGVIRGKKRREGASSQACSNLIYECIFFKNSFCGLVSKTLQDSRDTFTDMVAFGYRQLPVFLMPKQLNDKDSVTEFVFAHKSTKIVEGKATVIDSDTGHRSRVNYRAPVENAYDRGRMSRLLGDEGGKWPKDVPFSKFIAKVSKTMIMGAKRVGFAELPSTCNEMTKAGGAEFKIVWDEADQFKNPGQPTVNQFVRYFSPAFDGYEGFIDKHGLSVIDKPTDGQFEYLVEKWVGKSRLTEDDIRLGAKAFLLKLREGKQGSSLEEEIRQNPFNEREMFMAKNGNCHFDAVLLMDLYDSSKAMENEVLEWGNWTWKDGVPFTEAVWENCDKEYARWTRPKGFKIPEGDKVEWRGQLAYPLNDIQFISGCDPFQNSIVEDGKGSKASSGIINRYEPGTNDPFYNNLFVSKYHARPPMAKLFHMDMALQCFAYGCQILIEIKGNGGIFDFFLDNYLEPFLIQLPGRANYGVDPNQDNKALMVNLWEQYILTEGREGKLIYPDVIDDEYDGLIKFDVNETQRSDQVMGNGWTLVASYFKRANFRVKQEYSMEDFFPRYNN